MADMVSVKDGSAALIPARPAYSQASITARKESSLRKKLLKADIRILFVRVQPKKEGAYGMPPDFLARN